MRNLALTIILSAAAACAQTAKFEVASIKPSDPAQGTDSSGNHSGQGRLVMNNVTLKRCIMGAYGISPNIIFGGPAWLDVDRFEISAKAEQATAGDKDMMMMLQGLLAERFKLAIHRETKMVDAYVIEVAKGGPKMAKGDGNGGNTSAGRGTIDAKNSSMDHFAEVLSRHVDLPVVNHTNLDGVFTFALKWTPESTNPSPDARIPEGPSLFTAVQEQLGLRIHVQKTPLEVVVIDRAEKPSDN